jgi:hypothetical protein
MVAPVHNLDPTILPEGSAKLRWGRGGGGGQGTEFDRFYLFLGSSEDAMVGGARSAPLGVAMSPKRRVRAAHGRAREAKTH